MNFGDALWFDGGRVMRDIEYPAALKASLRLETALIDDSLNRETYFGTLASAVMNCGFEIFYRDDI